jgi:hypothetical protein
MNKVSCCKRGTPAPPVSRFLLLTLLFTAFATTAASAGAPEWLRAAARTSLPTYPAETEAVMLLDEQVTTVKDNGEITTLYRGAYKILRPQGEGYGTVVVFYDNETRLTFLKAWSIPASGAEYEVKEKDAVEVGVSASTLYSDNKRKVLKIPGSTVGSVVGYEYEQRDRPYVYQDRWWFQSSVPVKKARFVLRLPAGWEYETFWSNYAAKDPQGGNGQWTWELEDLPAIEYEPSMPNWRAIAGRMAVNYFPPKPELKGRALSSWSDVGQWYGKLIADRRAITPEIKQKVTELTAAAADPLAKIRALVTFAQKDIRYVAIEIGIGGFQPHYARDIFSSRYGDCKDKVTLLSTMLKEIGVDSQYVLVHTERGVVASAHPTAMTFNHVILGIRLPAGTDTTTLYAVSEHPQLGKILFFDPTDSITPLGHLPASLQASAGLMVTAEGGEIATLPLMPPSLNRLLRVAKLQLTPSGTLVGEVQEVRGGYPAARRRSTLLDLPLAERNKVLENFLANSLGGFALQNLEVENLDNNDSNLVVRYKFVAQNYAKSVGDLLLLRPRVVGHKSSDVLEGKPRKYPLEFATASLDSDIFEIALPSGYTVDELPPPVEVKTAFAEYKSTVEVNGNVLRYQRDYKVHDVRVPVDKLEEMKKFYRQVAADERSSAVLKRVQ